jgi:predicted dehydrogenase
MRAVTSDDVCGAWLRFRSGALATIAISLVEGRRQHRITLAGESGWAALDEQGPLDLLVAGEAERRSAPDWGLPEAAQLGIPDTDWSRGFLLLARALEHAIRSGDPSGGGIAATFEDGHRTQLVLDAIRESDRTGEWTKIPEAGAPPRRKP